MFIISPTDRIFVLTGAGVSAESGIPTFRGVGGFWRNYRIEEVASRRRGIVILAWCGSSPGVGVLLDGWYRGNGQPEGRRSCWVFSKWGNPYLCKMFLHGARAVVLRAKREGWYLGQWIKSLEGRAARNVVIVATANKLARMSWAVLSGENYRPMPAIAFAS